MLFQAADTLLMLCLCAGFTGRGGSSRSSSQPGSVGSNSEEAAAGFTVPDFQDGLIISSTCFLLKSDAKQVCAVLARLLTLGSMGVSQQC